MIIKELHMATIDTYPNERRHIPDRRTHGKSVSSTRMSTLDWVAMTLLVVGGINWGLIGLFSFDLVAAIFGAMSPLTRIIYTLVGLSAIYSIYTSTKMVRKQT
jgi:uncharacterized membrane protein YuzA (DUF378 family)